MMRFGGWLQMVVPAAVGASALLAARSLAAAEADAAVGPTTSAASGRVEFDRDVRPILSNHCFKCHGPGVQEADLRLDRPRSATAELPSGNRAIVPGDLAAGELWKRVTTDDAERRMPPVGKAPPLASHESDVLRRWILAGARYERHWAYVPPVAAEPPAVRDAAWPRNPIDYFVLHRLEAAGLSPAPEAVRETLIRRVALDLVGLPPTPAEVQAFVNDPEPGAYERLVDRLLASPQYGVRQALVWLDLARYADSDGYPHDRYRAVWPFRDWVVDALNDDMPYDRFTIEQIAGDLLPGASDRQRLASGFHRQTRINREAGVDPEEFRLEAVIDRVNTTATVWLGATLGCAQCHDHKYDPFTQRDYYRLLAYFNNDAAETTINPAGVISDVSPRIKWHTEAMRAREESPVETLVMQALGEPRPTHVFVRGSFLSLGEQVTPGTPEVLDVAGPEAGDDRLALARWLVNRQNPLTARVAVNRMWAQFFGSGLVETLDDLGAQAPACTHPELLDWLAVRFMDTGWRRKALVRLLVTSAAYRQASAASDAAIERDPENRLLSRASRVRLPAELVRDNALAVGGVLSKELGGPSLPANKARSDDGLYRRSIYLRWTRQTLADVLVNFDAPTRDVTCTRRTPTNTPLQALTLLNDDGFVDAARGLARRARGEGGRGFDEQLDFAFRAALARSPGESERRVLGDLFERRRSEFAALPTAAEALLAEPDAPRDELAERAAWVLVANTLLNVNEFITRP